MDDIDELVNWQMDKRPDRKVWRGCRNDHAWEQWELDLPLCPKCGEPAR